MFDKQLNPGIFGGAKVRQNRELMNLSAQQDIEVPTDYVSAKMDRVYLENDFRKFRFSYVWNPAPSAWELTRQAYMTIFSPQLNAEFMSFSEAINKMELSASPGFPWNSKYKTKRDCLKSEEEGGVVQLIYKIVCQIFETGEIDYEFEGVRYTDVFWLTSPKSEIRPIEKYNNPDPLKRKTRTFMCGDLVTHIVGFMLYKTQNDNGMRRSKDTDWSTVGTSPWYGGWDRFSRTLLRNGSRKFHSMDVSHMEASVSKSIQQLIYDTRNGAVKWCKDKEFTREQLEVAKSWYFDQITDSLIIDVNGFLCQKFGKNPSGQLGTLTDNTSALIIVFLYSIAKVSKSVDEVVNAYDEIANKCLGDDSLFEDDWRLLNVIEDARDLGFDFTYEAEPANLDKCRFLNSNFVLHKGRGLWIQKPNFEKILANVLFNFKKSSWRYTWVKLCAARKLVWAFPEWRDIIDLYLTFVKEKKYNHMKEETHIDSEITFEAAMAQYMTDEHNAFLIFGDESFSGFDREAFHFMSEGMDGVEELMEIIES